MEALISGGFLGVLGLIAIWFVFGGQPAWRRTIIALSAPSVFLCLVPLIGGTPKNEVLSLALFLPGLALNATGLLWVWRYWCGWSLVVYRSAAAVTPRRRHQFTLRDLFFMTSVIAIVVAMTRAAAIDNPQAGSFEWILEVYLMPPVVVAGAIVPCIAIVFLGRMSPFVATSAYGLALGIVVGMLYTAMSRYRFDFLAAFESGRNGLMAIMLITMGLVVARQRGVVLLRGYG